MLLTSEIRSNIRPMPGIFTAKALTMLKVGVNILQIMRATIMRHRAVWVSKPLCLLSVITRQVTMGFKIVHKI